MIQKYSTKQLFKFIRILIGGSGGTGGTRDKQELPIYLYYFSVALCYLNDPQLHGPDLGMIVSVVGDVYEVVQLRSVDLLDLDRLRKASNTVSEMIHV